MEDEISDVQKTLKVLFELDESRRLKAESVTADTERLQAKYGTRS